MEGVTHDYARHGTTTLSAALDIKTGEIFAQCKHRRRHQEFLALLRDVDRNVPPHLDVHLILDNSAPTGATRSGLGWPAIGRGSSRKDCELIDRIERVVNSDNEATRPFRWTATADSILGKLDRLTQRISGTLAGRLRPAERDRETTAEEAIR